MNWGFLGSLVTGVDQSNRIREESGILYSCDFRGGYMFEETLVFVVVFFSDSS